MLQILISSHTEFAVVVESVCYTLLTFNHCFNFFQPLFSIFPSNVFFILVVCPFLCIHLYKCDHTLIFHLYKCDHNLVFLLYKWGHDLDLCLYKCDHDHNLVSRLYKCYLNIVLRLYKCDHNLVFHP